MQTQPRRGLRREEAAAYVSLSPSMFDKMIKDGRLPKPKKFGGASVWDMRQLDLVFDALPDANNDNVNPWD
jgi:predicted DNA-binding transcriptional regulator AlpA